MIDKTTITQDIIDLVVARLEALPPNIAMSIGGEGGLDVEELIKRVKACDEVGKQIIEMQLVYLRSLKNLSPIENVATNN